MSNWVNGEGWFIDEAYSVGMCAWEVLRGGGGSGGGVWDCLQGVRFENVGLREEIRRACNLFVGY